MLSLLYDINGIFAMCDQANTGNEATMTLESAIGKTGKLPNGLGSSESTDSTVTSERQKQKVSGWLCDLVLILSASTALWTVIECTFSFQ